MTGTRGDGNAGRREHGATGTRGDGNAGRREHGATGTRGDVARAPTCGRAYVSHQDPEGPRGCSHAASAGEQQPGRAEGTQGERRPKPSAGAGSHPRQGRRRASPHRWGAPRSPNPSVGPAGPAGPFPQKAAAGAAAARGTAAWEASGRRRSPAKRRAAGAGGGRSPARSGAGTGAGGSKQDLGSGGVRRVPRREARRRLRTLPERVGASLPLRRSRAARSAPRCHQPPPESRATPKAASGSSSGTGRIPPALAATGPQIPGEHEAFAVGALEDRTRDLRLGHPRRRGDGVAALVADRHNAARPAALSSLALPRRDRTGPDGAQTTPPRACWGCLRAGAPNSSRTTPQNARLLPWAERRKSCGTSPPCPPGGGSVTSAGSGSAAQLSGLSRRCSRLLSSRFPSAGSPAPAPALPQPFVPCAALCTGPIT